ncbi:MAG: tRNA (adenosine(37)-N6)-threonylcarbamoyltransferase complex transferase subunit TsaD, partial [Erysipelotrichaceae bacterium]
PLLSLVVSGGHTELAYQVSEFNFKVLGSIQDDAVGEAFDKVARVLGLPYPGGPQIDKLAKLGKANYKLPKVKTENPLDFSFSGLKSAVLQTILREERLNQILNKEDCAYAFQEAALFQLLSKTKLALDQFEVKHLVLAGGVAANSRLRELITDLKQSYPDLIITIPPMWCCTDNGAMIGAAAEVAYRHHVKGDLSLSAKASIDY